MATGVDQLMQALAVLGQAEQRELVQRLRVRLQTPDEERGWLDAVPSTFGFWDNDEDAVYDCV